MYNFSEKSQSKINECHKDIQTICDYLIKFIDFTVITGYRSPAEQLEKVKQGLSKVKVSKHNSNPSMAIDIAPYPIDWKDRERFYFLAGYFLGTAKMLKEQGKIKHDVRSGCDWDRDGEINDNKFDDLGHFELI